MFISQADPFDSVAKPASDYIWLARRAETNASDGKSIAVPVDSEGSELSGSEEERADADDTDVEAADALLPDALAGSDGKDVKDSKDPPADTQSTSDQHSGSGSAAIETHRPGTGEMLFEVAVFAENTYISEYLRAGVSSRGRARRLSAAGAVALFSSVNR